jgi:predicted enzyme related to lactoylglutathione lyase
MQGLRTVIYPVQDLAAASAWYQAVFQTKPYFVQPFYIGFQIGGFELGLVPDGRPSADGQVVYWGCEQIEQQVDRLHRECGARIIAPVADVGDGIKVAIIADPDGNSVGLIENPNFVAANVR